MRLPRLLCEIAFLILAADVALAGPQQDKQAEGEETIGRALALSDIRATNASAFRLKATFQSLGAPQAIPGSYSEAWISREQWHREIEVDDSRMIEVGGPGKEWLLHTAKGHPFGATLVTNALIPNIKPGKIKAIKIRILGGVTTKCVETETEFSQEVYCVDPIHYVLLLHETAIKSNPMHHSTFVYRNYTKFGDHLFPMSVEYLAEGKPEMEIKIVELVPGGHPDPAQFTPLQGAEEVANCPWNEMTPPQGKFTPDPGFPKDTHINHALVVLWMILGTDGVPHDVRVSQSSGPAFDTQALLTVAHWQFKPFTCRGEPVASPINVEFSFRR